MRTLAFLSLVALSGCWKTEFNTISETRIAFEPSDAVERGWWVEKFDTELICPNGENSRLYVIYPDAADIRFNEDAPEMPLAILFHSGSFDYKFLPQPNEPLFGSSYRSTVDGQSFLRGAWSVERTFATLGLYPNDDRTELHDATLPIALVNRGIAVLMPTNCWGDFWHNRTGVAENDYSSDYFFRDGRTAAEFAWAYATRPFPPGNPVDFPIAVDDDRIFLIGLGEGSRAVSELLHAKDSSGDPLYTPAGLVFDSPIDDLRPYYDRANESFRKVANGLDRIFPEGRSQVMSTAYATAPFANQPARTALLYSTNDTRIPNNANAQAIERILGPNVSEGWVYEGIEAEHILTNSNAELAEVVVDFLAQGLDTVPESYRN